ncbi:MAG: VWA domain-containing protein, partial [Eubacteriales bacterium]|nr:VWA domain-containing protein [Eubacteriales bacterium]
MFCKKCGNQLTDGDVFCPNCGTAVEQQGVQSFAQVTKEAQNMQNQQYVSQPYPAANEPKPVKQPKVPKKPKKIGLVVVLMIVVAIGIAGLVAGLILLNRDGKKPEESKPAVQEESTQVGDLGYEENAFSKTPLNLTALNNLTPGSDEKVKARNAEIATIQAAVSGVKNSAGESYTTVAISKISEYLNDVSKSLDELSKSGTKVSYTKNADNIRVTLTNGGCYMIIPNVEGTDEGDNSDDIKIATYQPCLSGYSTSISKYMTYIDDGAVLIDNEFDKYTFKKDGSSTDDDYNDSEVNFNACASVSQYYMLLWHGHGGYDSSVGSFLLTGVKRTEENDKKLSAAIENKEILMTADSYVITAAFINKYVASDSLENAVVYLGACQSGKDSKLANAFLNKGAVAVYANSETIHTTYNLSMIKSVCEGLTKKNSTGAYNSVSEALTYAKNINGNYDTGELRTTETKLFTKKDEDKNFTLDWYQSHKKTDKEVTLVLDVSGSMSGTPITETKNASVKFVETVLGASAKVGLVTYATNVTMASDFSLNKTTLESKINALSASGSTYTEGGLAKAAEMFSTSSSDDKIIVLMSDGLPNRGKDGDDLVDYAQTLKDKGYTIYTVGFFSSLSGSDKAGAQDLMNRIASPGCNYEVNKAEDLTDFFDDIAAQINGQKYMYIKVQGPTNVTVTSGGETLSSSTNSSRTSFGSISYQESTGSSSGSSSSGS